MNLNPLSWFTRRPAAPTPAPAPFSDPGFEARWVQRKEKLLLESYAGVNPGDFIQPWSTFYDGLKLLFPLFPLWHYTKGTLGYISLTQGQLDLFRAYGRWQYEANPYAQAGLECLADYVIARGFAYNVSSRRHVNASKGLLKTCNKFLEDALNKNRWWRRERELFIARKRDGDAFIRLFPQEDGITQIRNIPSEFIRSNDPDGNRSFGVETPDEDMETHLAYSIWSQREQRGGEWVPADEMFMFQNHTSMDVKRGLGDFFNIQQQLDDAANLLKAGAQGEAVRQCIAYVVQWAQANSATVSNFGSTFADGQTNVNLPGNVTTTSNVTRTENVQRVLPGEVIDISKGMEFQNGPVGNADNAQKMLDSSLRAAAVKWRLPAWALTGDVSVNFAAALVAESPLVKRAEWDQFRHVKEYCAVCERLLEIGAMQGILPQDVLEKVEVTAEGAPVAARNLLQETQINAILRQHKLLSKRTWSARENLDHDAEQDEIREEPEDTPLPDGQAVRANSGTPGAEYQRSVDRPE